MPEQPKTRHHSAVGFLVTGVFAVVVVWFAFGEQLAGAFSSPVDRVMTGSVN